MRIVSHATFTASMFEIYNYWSLADLVRANQTIDALDDLG